MLRAVPASTTVPARATVSLATGPGWAADRPGIRYVANKAVSTTPRQPIMNHDRRAAWPRPNDRALRIDITIAATPSPAQTETLIPQPILNGAVTNHPNVTSTTTITVNAVHRQIEYLEGALEVRRGNSLAVSIDSICTTLS